MNYFLMSFKPIYAHEIIDGVKDCEVRTYFGLLSKGDVVIVYSSSPERAFLGEFRVYDVFVDYPDVISGYLRALCRAFDEINWHFFRSRYLSKRRRLLMLKIGDVLRYKKFVKLAEVRNYIHDFKPPMSYVAVDREFVRLIRTLVSMKDT